MSRRLIDLSVTLVDKEFWPPHHRPRITYRSHDETWESFERAFPGIAREQIPDGKSWATEEVTLVTHAGTHMDAPWHFHPTMDHALVPGGRPAATIEQVPLDWCHRPGVKLDFSRMAPGSVVTAADVEGELARIGHTLQPLDIVLVQTPAAPHYGTPHYQDNGIGVGRAATLYLTERGVRMVGTDAWGWDAPFGAVMERYARTGDASTIWEGHKAGRDIGYFQMEKLANLDQLPGHGFTVICFPVKIQGASAGWTRAVAVLDD